MKLVSKVRVGLTGALVFGALAVACSAESADSGESTATAVEPIINGNVPAPGGLAGYGVVMLENGCTGTLLDNKHVLTAHHCVRGYNGTWASALASPIIVNYEDGGVRQSAGTAQVFEPDVSWTLDAHDFALLALSVPIKVSGSASGFSNAIYSSADSTLAGQSVLCIGYGGTVAATATTFANGFNILTSATMTISGTSSGFITRNKNGSNQVGFGGDSGSTCFSSGKVVGVQSTCGGYTWFDVNGNSVDDGWNEHSAPSSCRDAAPSQFRTWAQQKQLETVNTNFVYAAALAGALG